MHVTATLQGLSRLAPLLATARRAEEISRDVARRQGSLAAPPLLQRALLHQSRQEAAHAAVFASALALLPGRPACPPALASALAGFEARLHADLDRGALAASMFGLQCVLEGLGSVALQPPEGEVAALGDRFLPLRGLLLQQELGHRRLGEVWVARLAAGAPASGRAALQASARAYIDLAGAVVAAGLEAVGEFAEEGRHYAPATQAFLGQLVIPDAVTEAPDV